MAFIKYFFFNGQQYFAESDLTIFQLIEYFNYNSILVVLEYNKLICNKKHWNQIFIQTDDQIEIITIVGGG
jgi:thiamine biosynthesis protein ThiS